MFTTFCFTPSILSNINKYSVKCHCFGVVGVHTKYKKIVSLFSFALLLIVLMPLYLKLMPATVRLCMYERAKKQPTRIDLKPTDQPTDQLSIFCIGTKTPCIKSIF